MASPAYTRLENDERRALLLAVGQRLFAEHAFDEISMAQIAREAGISKALLYHYFPSKRDFFVATLAGGAEELRRRVEPDPALPPAEALTRSVDAYLRWIEERPGAFEKLIRSAAAIPEVRELVDGVRSANTRRILEGVGAQDNAAARSAVAGWLWFMDGAILDWIAHGDPGREELQGVLLAGLVGALAGAGVTPPA